MSTSSNALEIWVVYNRPKDFPDHMVARKWLNDSPTHELLKSESLDDLRQMLPPGLYRQPRHENDDPSIVESWF